MTLGFFTAIIVFLMEAFFAGKYSVLDMISVATIVVSLYNIVMLIKPEKMA